MSSFTYLFSIDAILRSNAYLFLYELGHLVAHIMSYRINRFDLHISKKKLANF